MGRLGAIEPQGIPRPWRPGNCRSGGKFGLEVGGSAWVGGRRWRGLPLLELGGPRRDGFGGVFGKFGMGDQKLSKIFGLRAGPQCS